jgi:hypothetical protein
MQSLNELIAHSIECIHASMSIRKQGESGIGMGTNKNLGGGGGHQTEQTSNGFTPVQNGVLNLLKTVTTMTGYSVTEICKQLKQFNDNQVK